MDRDEACKTKTIGETTAIRYEGTGRCDARLSKMGYDLFYAGAVFDENWKIVKAYIDSHVVSVSGNYHEIDEMLDE